jgi:virginiamycin B lyase
MTSFLRLTSVLIGSCSIALSGCAQLPSQSPGTIREFPLAWPGTGTPSTHEITYNHTGGTTFWVTGPEHDAIAQLTLDGKATFYPMPAESGPHGIAFDAAGHLWVSLEHAGQVVRLDAQGKIVETVDVSLHARGTAAPLNTHPHGLAVGGDGKTLWFTGKKTNTVGRINPDRSVEHFDLPTVGAVPIYLALGPDGAMWCTELVGNQIARITPAGEVTEFAIPTFNSRPIAIMAGPDGRSLWFSEEAGHKVARITLDGTITEFPVPMTQRNMILASLTFDRDGRLWTQSYVDPHSPFPAGADQLVCFDRAIQTTTTADLAGVAVNYYSVPSRGTTMHRLTQGPDGAIWFTELALDKVGKLILAR